MDTSEDILRKAMAEKQTALEAQGNAVRTMKAAGAAKQELDAAIEALNGLKL
jgi:glycyl-tRNA synthetase